MKRIDWKFANGFDRRSPLVKSNMTLRLTRYAHDTLSPGYAVVEAQPLNERLQKFRDSLGLSQADLAAKLGVSTITLYRWETGSTRPSPLAARKLESIGFGVVKPFETNVMSVPRLKAQAEDGNTKTTAVRLRDHGKAVLRMQDKHVTTLPASFVRNGPPDQVAFHSKMLELQVDSILPISDLCPRLSMVEEVDGFGQTCQHLLEKPRLVCRIVEFKLWEPWLAPIHRTVSTACSSRATELLWCRLRIGGCVTPFAGSGTTAVECRLLGIPFVGIEICPLSAMMTRTKAEFPNDPKQLFGLSDEFITFYDAKWKEFIGKGAIGEVSHEAILKRKGNDIPAFANVERWFSKEALLGASIAVEFGMTKEGFAREAVLVALSSRMRSMGTLMST